MTMILLVDDNKQNRYMLEVLLKAQGYDVSSADNGAAALAFAEQHPPDLIITDVLMPVMDGFSLCRRWKTDDRFKHIPFIFYTATYTEPKDEKFGLSLGAERYIIKPQQPEVLVRAVQDLLKDFQKKSPGKPMGEEMEYFRHYNEVLFNKLENKMVQLEHTKQALERDIAERKRAEDALLKEKTFTNLVIDSLPGVFYVCDEQGRLVRWNNNEKDLAIYSMQELMQMNILQLFQSDRPLMENMIREAFETGRATVEASLASHNGSTIPFLFTGLRMEMDGKRYIVGVGINVSDRTLLEQQLRQAQKMEALGLLAGGVAHDLNNALTIFSTYGNLLSKKLKDAPVLRTYAERIVEATDNAVELTQSLLAFSRKQTMTLKSVNLNDVVRNIEKLLLRIIGEDIDLKTNLADRELTVMAHGGQIEQVLMNLATNARDAMPQGGQLSIQTESVKLEESDIKAADVERPGWFARISVTDTGCGMDRETAEKIFEPFFTTKEVGKGTGLGLAIVYGIIKQHNGTIRVYSEPGNGTIFKIYLPLLSTKAALPFEKVLPAAHGGTETILVAEDNAEVRRSIRIVLEDSGYNVIEAEDGDDAITKFILHQKEIDLLLTDVIMPRKNGKEVYDTIKSMRPGIPVLFMSGYTADIITSKGLLNEGLHLLHKPPSPDTLKRVIRTLLNTKQGRL